MKNIKATDVPILTIDPAIALFTYRQVKQMFAWKGNKSIRDAVKRGDLARVRIGAARSQWRITAESALALLHDKKEEIETQDFFGIHAAEWAVMKANKARENEIEQTKQLTPEEQNAQFYADEAKKPVIWVGSVGFQGVDENGHTAETRAIAYANALEEARRKKYRYTATQERGV